MRQRPPDATTSSFTSPVSSSVAARLAALPEPVREFARIGHDRTVDYQDARYGALYLDRVEGLIARLSTAAPAVNAPEPEAPHAAAREVARQLALWMCFEDLIRVADLKTRRTRIERVRAEVRAKPGQPVTITEFLKPGVDEWCSVLPGWLARPILRAADRGGWRRRLNVGLHVRTSSVSGFLLMWTLARLKRLRRGMHRFREEEGRIETWLGRVGEAYEASPALAVEVAKWREPRQGLRGYPRARGPELRAHDSLSRGLHRGLRPSREPSRAPGGGARRSRRRPARRSDRRPRGRRVHGQRLKDEPPGPSRPRFGPSRLGCSPREPAGVDRALAPPSVPIPPGPPLATAVRKAYSTPLIARR